MSRYYNDDGFDEFEVDDDELYHFGIKGQKWGLRRFQNEDGTLTPEGKMRYLKTDSAVTKRVKKDWNTMSDKEFMAKYRGSKKTYLKRVRKYGDPYMNSPLAKLGKKLTAKQKGRPYRDSDAQEELDLIAKDKGKLVKFDKKTAVKTLAGLAVTAAGAAAIYKMMNKGDGVTGDSLQKNFSSAFDKPARKPDRVTQDSLQKNFSSAFNRPNRTTPDSLQKNFSSAFDRPNRTTPDSLQKNFSDAFDLRKPDRVTSDSLQRNFSNAFNQNHSSGTTINRHHSTDPVTSYNKRTNDKVNKVIAKADKAIADTDKFNKEFADWKKKNYKNEAEYRKDYEDRMKKGREEAQKKFNDSIEAARAAGVPENKILKTKNDIDNYFGFGRMSQEEFDRGMSDPDSRLVFDSNGVRFEKKKK
jgi:hypothetical protein